MKCRILMTVAAVVGLAVLITLAGCKKQEPSTSPHEGHEHEHEAVVQPESADQTAAGQTEQTTCPVMGGKINKDIFTEYKGKKVYFCCPSCKTEFDKDPEKYISKLPQFQNAAN